MDKTIVALFDHAEDAHQIVRDLVDNGFERGKISLITQSKVEGERDQAEGESSAAEGAGKGAGIGAVVGGIGGLLVGIGALAIPGIGPLVAAGPLLATLAGAGVGAGLGALVGALVGLGIPKEQAEYYAEGVRRGGTLVAVQTEEARVQHAISIMERHNPVNIEQRTEEWRSSGWTPEESPAEMNQRMMASQPQSASSQPQRYEREQFGDRFEEPASTELHEEAAPPPTHDEPSRHEIERENERALGQSPRQPQEQEHISHAERSDLDRHAVHEPSSEEGHRVFADRPSGSQESARHSREESNVGEFPHVTEEIDIAHEYGRERSPQEESHAIREEGPSEYGQGELDATFRRHFQSTYADRGYSYERFEPAYRYGAALAESDGCDEHSWEEIESEVKARWEETNPDTWDEFCEAVREGWNENCREKLSDYMSM